MNLIGLINKEIVVNGEKHYITQIARGSHDLLQVYLRRAYERNTVSCMLEVQTPEALEILIEHGFSTDSRVGTLTSLKTERPRLTFGEHNVNEDTTVTIKRFDIRDDEETIEEVYHDVKKVLLNNDVWCTIVFEDARVHAIRRDHIYDVLAGKSVLVK